METELKVPGHDRWTAKTKGWFNERYLFATNGLYFPHQPVYGFSLYEEYLKTYVRTYGILKAIEGLPFSTFLDVGCAEGYFPNIVGYLFGAKSYGCDFALSGLQKAKLFFGIQGIAADAHLLPFKDRAFDLVLCSEVIEHVADPEKVIQELIRICNKYLVVTTPAARTLQEREHHFRDFDPALLYGHIHFFMEEEIRRWFGEDARIQGCRMHRMESIYSLISDKESMSKTVLDAYRFILDTCPDLTPETRERFKIFCQNYGSSKRKVIKWLVGPRLVKMLLRLDHWLSTFFPTKTADFLIIKAREGAPLEPCRPGIRRLLDYLLVKNRVAPLPAAMKADGE